eukprot:COSAG02_NODE_33806_length_494_cov_0.787342_1_plen_23_part_01
MCIGAGNLRIALTALDRDEATVE